MRLEEMARVGWVPENKPRDIEVFVHTDDKGNVPHFHIRKYGDNNKFEWEACIKYESADYFAHGKYRGTISTKIAKELDKMLRQNNPKDPGRTYWQSAVIDWNRNNSSVELPIDLEQPDYTKLNKKNENFDDIESWEIDSI